VAKKNDNPITPRNFFPSRYSLLWGVSRPQQLKYLLSRLEKLGRDPKFLEACDKYFENANPDRVQFFEQWGAFPIYSYMLSPESFQKCAERAAEKAGATKTIVVYPWTSTKALVRSLSAGGFLKSAAKTNFEELWKKTFLLFLKIYGYTAKDIAEALGEKTSRKRRKQYSDELGEREIGRINKILISLNAKGIEWHTADQNAIRIVKKARYREASIIPNIRMEYNRALKGLEKISCLIKSHSRPRS
jgi:hypothetical protein